MGSLHQARGDAASTASKLQAAETQLKEAQQQRAKLERHEKSVAAALGSAGRDSYYSGVSAASASSVSDGDGESLLSGSVSGDDYDAVGAGSLDAAVR